MVTSEEIKELITLAEKSKENSYSPYSNFKVGSGLLIEGGEMFGGCNIENISFTPTVCAERTAIFKAISEGKTELKAISVITDDDQPSSPCGVCLQVMAEFASDDFELILAKDKDTYELYKLRDLLGRPFRSSRPIGQKQRSI